MNEETGSRIAAAMADLQYVPNRAAASLRSSRTYSIGFLMVDSSQRYLADPMTDLILGGVGDIARERGYSVLVHSVRSSQVDRALLRPILEHRVDGGLVFLSGSKLTRKWYMEQLSQMQLPLIVFGERAPSRAMAISVAGSDRQATRQLTSLIVARGHRRIAFVAAKTPWPMIEERHLGYREALRAASLQVPAELQVFDGEWTPSDGYRSGSRLLLMDSRPTAIVCGNDLLALGVMKAAREIGLVIPRDLAVTGFDDFDFAEFTDPPLTTAHVHGYEMGRIGTSLLIDAIENRAVRQRAVRLPVELVVRDSI